MRRGVSGPEEVAQALDVLGVDAFESPLDELRVRDVVRRGDRGRDRAGIGHLYSMHVVFGKFASAGHGARGTAAIQHVDTSRMDLGAEPATLPDDPIDQFAAVVELLVQGENDRALAAILALDLGEIEAVRRKRAADVAACRIVVPTRTAPAIRENRARSAASSCVSTNQGRSSGQRLTSPSAGRSFDVALEHGQHSCLHDPDNREIGGEASKPSRAEGFIAADNETCAPARQFVQQETP